MLSITPITTTLPDTTPAIEIFPSSRLGELNPPVSRCFDDPRGLPPREDHYLLTLVLDLDETLIYARETDIAVRPFARNFLESVSAMTRTLPNGEEKRSVEVILWSAGARPHVDRCMSLLDPSNTIFSFAICRGHTWLPSTTLISRAECRELSLRGGRSVAEGAGDDAIPCVPNVALKDLSLLPGRGESAILVDDSPFAALCSGGRTLVIPRFSPHTPAAAADTTLLFLVQVVSFMASVIDADAVAREAGDAEPRTPAGAALARKIGAWKSAEPAPPADARSPEIVHAAVAAAVIRHAFPPANDAKISPFIAVPRYGATPQLMETLGREYSLFSPDASIDSDSVLDDDWCPACSTTPRASENPCVCKADRSVAASVLSAWRRMTDLQRLDDCRVPRVFRSHPFVGMHTLPTPFGPIIASALDVTDSDRLGVRVTSFLAAFAE